MFSRSKRMGKKEFREVLNQKPDFVSYLPHFIVKYYSKTDTKIAIVISKSTIKTSSKRNLVKRRLRHLLFLSISSLKPGFYVFIVRQKVDIKAYSYENLSTDLNTFLSENH